MSKLIRRRAKIVNSGKDLIRNCRKEGTYKLISELINYIVATIKLHFKTF